MGSRLSLFVGIFFGGIITFYFLSTIEADPEPSQLYSVAERDTKTLSLSRSEVPIDPGASPVPEQEEAELRLSREEVKAIKLIKARFLSGDYLTSLKLIETHLEQEEHSEDFLEWLQKQLQAVLTATGWMKIKTGDCEGALTDLARAVEYGKDKAISSGMAYCYHQLRLWDDARAEFQWYLEREPKDINAINLYADVLESSRSYGQAVQVLEDAIEYSEKQDEIELLRRKLSAMKKKEVESYFQEHSQSRNFSLLFHGEVSSQVAEWVLSTLEKAHEELIERWSMKPLRGPVEVVIYSQETFTDIMIGGPHWMGGVFDGRIRIPLIYHGLTEQQFWDNLATTLRHELVHAVFADMTRRRPLPAWFEEGLAQRFTCEGLACNVLEALPTPGDFFSEADFEQSFTQYGTEKASVIYKQSLYLILCLERMNGFGSLRDVVEPITHQGPLDSDSILKRMGISFESLVRIAGESWQKREDLTSSR